jgi:glycosyltransferase involved in cell wall biosynthesis/predicted Zn-dependent protease
MTPEMAEYAPHIRGTSFPALDRAEMRRALRQTYEMGQDTRCELTDAAYKFLDERYSFAATTPPVIESIKRGWEAKRHRLSLTASAGSVGHLEDSVDQPQGGLKISWCGLQLFHGRPGTVNRESCLELMRRGHTLSLVPGCSAFHVEEFDIAHSPKYKKLAASFYEQFQRQAHVNISSRWHPSYIEQPADRQVLFNTWWSGSIPIDWVRPISEYVDEVWVPSEFVRQNFSAACGDKVHVVPIGFDPAVYHPRAPLTPLKTRKRFKFLFIGEATARKGFDQLLIAYLKTFSSHDDVCLVVKDMSCEDYYVPRAGKSQIDLCRAKVPSCPEIEYLDGMISEAELAGIYTACDCFVQPFRASSFGLAVLEAMACGLPVVVTNYGGVTEFCDQDTACLLPAKEVRRPATLVGHWRVSGEQLHAEVKIGDLQERLREAVRRPAAAATRAAAAAERVHAQYTWRNTVDRMESRMTAMLGHPSKRRTNSPVIEVRSQPGLAGVQSRAGTSPTLLIVAPFYNRSGYGVSARALVAGLVAMGLKIRIVPVDNVEQGIDDCDLELFKQLQQTPLSLPIVAIFFHVPSANWLKIELPAQSVRIMYTTFDSSAQGNQPPRDWISVCQQMDQVWLGSRKEIEIFAVAGVDHEKMREVHCPHPWVNNPLLSLPRIGSFRGGRPFRFLSIAMFLPRRRWDVLIEAYLEEFRDDLNVELYLKVNYPSWHPDQEQPKRDLQMLIEGLREKTGSKAQLVLDEVLGTRRGICELIDSCDVYVSTDTTATAPVGEAFARGKIAVIPDGYGEALPTVLFCSESSFIIPVSSARVRPITESELLYQPHHRGKSMPLLCIEDVKHTLRASFDLPESQRHHRGNLARLTVEQGFGPAKTLPPMIAAIDECLARKFARKVDSTKGFDGNRQSKAVKSLKLSWQGSFLDFGSLSHVNREFTRQFAAQPNVQLTRVGDSTLSGGCAAVPELKALAATLASGPIAGSQITVRHAWPPDWSPVKQGALVVIQPWEYGSLPVEWVSQSRNVQQFWVPSEHVRKVYVSSGVPESKVKVVPNGIEPEKFRPDAKPLPLGTRKTFKFLFVGGTIHRKGPDVLLEAYLKSFSAQDDVCLVIKDFGGKSFYAGQTMEQAIQEIQGRPDAPEILYLNDELPPESLPGLYTACDCLVHPYRGEGFGLPVLEAMACGLPVIVTGGGAADDFAPAHLVYRVSSKVRGIGRKVSGMDLAGEGWMLEPSIPETASQMRHVFENREEARTRGRAASDCVRQEWTWECAVRTMRRYLDSLQADVEKGAAKTAPATDRKPAPIVAPPCARLGGLAGARELLRQNQLRQAWEAGLVAVAIRPCHPEAYMLLAQIAAQAGDGKMATRCADKASVLAPGLKEARRFAKKNFGNRNSPAWLTMPPGLVSEKMRLSVCLIARNEEKFLGACLASVRGLADEIIVVDTGSTDRTVDIAKEHGARVDHFTWCDDFSAARNAALAHATGDWVLILDADETVPETSHAALRGLIGNPKVMAWRLPIIDHGREEDGCSYVPRLFRNAPALFYVGRVHEQVFSSIEVRRQEWGLDNKIGDAVLMHFGYAPEVVKDRKKVERNLQLLEKALEEMPDESNLLMNYGLELSRSGRAVEALEQYRLAVEKMSALPDAQLVPETREMLLSQICSQLMSGNLLEELVEVLTSPLARRGGLNASLHFSLGVALLRLKRFVEAEEQLRLCLTGRDKPSLAPVNRDIRKGGPRHCLAMSLSGQGRKDAALEVCREAMAEDPQSRTIRFDCSRLHADGGQLGDALQLLHGLVTTHPGDAEAWQFGGFLALSHPELLDVAVDWTTEAVGNLAGNSDVLAQNAEALLLSGKPALALPLWQQSGVSTASRKAAGILCQLASGEDVRPVETGEEEVSREFIRWYQRILHYGGTELVLTLNQAMSKLEVSLPTASRVLRTAMAEADTA